MWLGKAVPQEKSPVNLFEGNGEAYPPTGGHAEDVIDNPEMSAYCSKSVAAAAALFAKSDRFNESLSMRSRTRQKSFPPSCRHPNDCATTAAESLREASLREEKRDEEHPSDFSFNGLRKETRFHSEAATLFLIAEEAKGRRCEVAVLFLPPISQQWTIPRAWGGREGAG
ncbi:hypothetical protein KM043_009101 [Ampulex compressa]|nr:hypothetical protein KM043_009101 [Ampulex compressa]